MTTFDERDKGFENKFAHDEEMAFKVHARMKKLVALWAAAQMGKNSPEAEQYASELVQAELSTNADSLIKRLQADFGAARLDVPPEIIADEIRRQTGVAREQVLGRKS